MDSFLYESHVFWITLYGRFSNIFHNITVFSDSEWMDGQTAKWILKKTNLLNEQAQKVLFNGLNSSWMPVTC